MKSKIGLVTSEKVDLSFDEALDVWNPETGVKGVIDRIDCLCRQGDTACICTILLHVFTCFARNLSLMTSISLDLTNSAGGCAVPRKPRGRAADF